MGEGEGGGGLRVAVKAKGRERFIESAFGIGLLDLQSFLSRLLHIQKYSLYYGRGRERQTDRQTETDRRDGGRETDRALCFNRLIESFLF